MNWFERFLAVREELAANPCVTLTHLVVEPEELGMDDDYAADILEDGGFVLAGGMREFFDSVHCVNIEWLHSGLDEAVGHPVVCGRLDVGSVDDIVFSGYVEPDIELMGPRDAAERAFLLELRHITTHHVSGDSWVALRPDADKVPQMWWRSTIAGGIDIPLDVDFEGLMDLLLKSRGVLCWPILCARLDSIRDEDRRSLLHDISSPASGLRQRLEILRNSAASADAAELAARLDTIVSESAASLI